MGTSQKLTDQFLTCAVCLEVLADPITLECYHTFCRKCVVSFTKTQPDAIKVKSLPCPFCGRLTKVTTHYRRVEEWANHLKPSFLMQGLIDSFGPGSKDTSNCNLCQEGGETIPSVAWCSVCDVSLCEGCVTAHRRNPASRHHDVSYLSNDIKMKRKRKVPCSEHKDEFIKFYCRSCKKSVCHTCGFLHHRKCEDVVSLESMIPEMKSALESRKCTLESWVQDRSPVLAKTKASGVEVLEKKASLQSQVRSVCQRIIDQVKKKEKCLMDQIETVSEEQRAQLKAKVKSTEMAIQIYQQDIEMIYQALESESENDLYSLYQSYESGNLESPDDTDGEMKSTELELLSRLQHIQNIDKVNEAIEGIRLGETDSVFKCRLNLKATPVLQDTIDVRVKEEQKIVFLSDVTVLVVNGINTVVVTYQSLKNKSLTSFCYRNNQPHHSILSLNSAAHSMTQVKHDQIAVTLGIKQIITVEVGPNLKLLSEMNTQRQYIGITSLTSTTLAVSSFSPPCVDIIDVSGNVLRSFIPVKNGKHLLKYPKFLSSTNNGNILVTDSGAKSVLSLTPKGDVVFNYFPSDNKVLSEPVGITVTSTGDILVADCSLHCVLHLTESGQFVRNILTSKDGLSYPLGIFVDKHERLYVALFDGLVNVYKSNDN